MQLKPLQDRVVVQRLDEETKTAGGIIIPDSHTEKPSQGKILAVGTGYRLTDGSVRGLDVKVAILFYSVNTQELQLRLMGKMFLL